ncbi:rCG37741 [Rattus norvegicus]|uniref:RCG37741 n=1 Tax=Rattus norvegicus TaxID=10116 RepID=A6JF45_RAT|nr:rCG37741 [Rattus norvegicus]
MWLLRRLPTRNMRVSFPSLMEITACSLNMRVSARFLGWDILMNMQPMRKASTMEPRMDWKRKRMMPSGHLSVM